MSATSTNAALRQELWRKQLFADVRDDLFMDKFMGESTENMVQELTDLKKEAGANISFGLGIKLAGAGISGDSALEGSEEAMTDYDEDVAINQLRNGVLMTGQMDEKKSCYDMRTSAKNRLATWWAERLDKEVIDKLCGKASSTFANTPTAAAATRSTYANGLGAIASVTSAAKMNTKLLDASKQLAKVTAAGTPIVRPLRVKGKEYYVAILHPYDATNLKQDGTYLESLQNAGIRGDENPIFTGALGIYNGIVIHEHEYVYRTNDGSGSAYVARNVLCGQQAAVIAWGKPVAWVEKSFDYGNQWGVSVGAIFGVIKPIFNAIDYGVITMYAGSAASTGA